MINRVFDTVFNMIDRYQGSLRTSPSRGGFAVCWMVWLCLVAPAWADPLVVATKTTEEPQSVGKDSARDSHTDIQNTGVIDLCGYGSESFDDLKSLLNTRGMGKKPVALARTLSDDPDQLLAKWEKDKNEVNEGAHDMIKIPLGHFIYPHYVVSCPQPFDNQNTWVLQILENEAGVIEIIDIQLFYDEDRNFAMRNERINANRYLSEDGFVRAVTSMVAARTYSRQQMREEMINGGFWLNQSCITNKTVTDTFIALPFFPESIFSLTNIYIFLKPRPHAAIAFSRPSEEFLYVENSGNKKNCTYDKEIYHQRVADFFLENYPEHWANKAIKHKKARKLVKEEYTQATMAFLKSLTPAGAVPDSALAASTPKPETKTALNDTPVGDAPTDTTSDNQIDLCSYDVESFDDLDALVQAKGLGKTVSEVALLSDDPAKTLADWEENSKTLG